eukprot:1857243-Amphidinium_carterae.1
MVVFGESQPSTPAFARASRLYLAGSIDFVAINNECVNDGMLHLFDWKRTANLPVKHGNRFGERMQVLSRCHVTHSVRGSAGCTRRLRRGALSPPVELKLYKHILEANYSRKVPSMS